MPTSQLQSPAFKQLLKEALAETLQEQRGLLHQVIAEVFEDVALGEAIRQGLQTEAVGRDVIMSALGKSE